MHQVLAVEHRIFSCSMWDLVPWPGIKPRPSAVDVQSLSHWTIREVSMYPFFSRFLSHVVIIECWAELPVLYSRSLLDMFYIQWCVCVNPSLLIYHSCHNFSLVTIKFVFKIDELVL